MSNITADPIELLRQVAPALQNGQMETLKQAAELVKRLQAEAAELRQALAAQSLPEAPSSVNFKMVHVATQTESQFTLRGHTDLELQERLQHRISSLIDSGWVAFDAYVDQRRAERGRESDSHNPQPASSSAVPPNCPTHNKPMKQSQRGGWYCPVKIAEDGGDGKPVYCKQKVN